MKNIETLTAAGVSKIVQYKVAGVPAPVDLYLDKGDSDGPGYQQSSLTKITNRELISRYPSPKSLEEIIARKYDVEPSNVVVTAGADDALERACRSVLSPGDELLQATPTFEMIERYALACGANVVRVPWPKEGYPLEEILKAKTSRTKIVAVVSPNNPTGQVVTPSELTKISESFSDSLVVLDLAYVEFATEDLTSLALSLSNVVITRSFSKAWGLAGLRIGYAIGPTEIVSLMRKSGTPFPVSSVSLDLAKNVFENEETAMKRFVAEIVRERDTCAEILRGLGGDVYDSQANFVCVSLPNAKFIWQALSGLGIAIRYFPHIPELSSILRITLPGNSKSFARLSAALKTVLNPEAILFDIDGVIADSSKSYRRTVIQTAASYGVKVTDEMITKLKSEGSANDDWELTQRLLSMDGVSVSLEEVTNNFENRYQGIPEGTGLCSLERLLGSIELIDVLSKNRKLGIVTGRPKKDALRFLERMEIAHYFPAIVTREDTKYMKPKPDAVLEALRQLNCQSAWMIGDTPDDISSARNATQQQDDITVLPVGVFAPWDDKEVMRTKLNAAGAGVILDCVTELKELLR